MARIKITNAAAVLDRIRDIFSSDLIVNAVYPKILLFSNSVYPKKGMYA
jgi:hypothetical protein